MASGRLSGTSRIQQRFNLYCAEANSDTYRKNDQVAGANPFPGRRQRTKRVSNRIEIGAVIGAQLARRYMAPFARRRPPKSQQLTPFARAEHISRA